MIILNYRPTDISANIIFAQLRKRIIDMTNTSTLSKGNSFFPSENFLRN